MRSSRGDHGTASDGCASIGAGTGTGRWAIGGCGDGSRSWGGSSGDGGGSVPDGGSTGGAGSGRGPSSSRDGGVDHGTVSDGCASIEVGGGTGRCAIGGCGAGSRSCGGSSGDGGGSACDGGSCGGAGWVRGAGSSSTAVDIGSRLFDVGAAEPWAGARGAGCLAGASSGLADGAPEDGAPADGALTGGAAGFAALGGGVTVFAGAAAGGATAAPFAGGTAGVAAGVIAGAAGGGGGGVGATAGIRASVPERRIANTASWRLRMRGGEPVVLAARLRVLPAAIERRRELEPRVLLIDVRGDRGLEVRHGLLEVVGLRVRDAEVVVHRRGARPRGLADERRLERRDHVGGAARLERGRRRLERGIDLHHLGLVRARGEHGALGARQREVADRGELRARVDVLASLEQLIDLPGTGVGVLARGELRGRHRPRAGRPHRAPRARPRASRPARVRARWYSR